MQITRKNLPALEEVLRDIPLTNATKKNIDRDKKEIQAILAGIDPRLIIITGPCSAWPYDAVIDYAYRLAKLNSKVKNIIKIIMRVYTQKARTKTGWLGPLIQPNPLSPPDIFAGIYYSRQLMLKIRKLRLSIVDEVLSTHCSKYITDLLSYATIGARSSEDPEHRILASMLECPVGLKNPTHGELSIAANSVFVAQNSHVTAFDGKEILTRGNEFAHLILRGSHSALNYSIMKIKLAISYLTKLNIKNPAILIDTSHDNCLVNGSKQPKQQKNVAMEVLNLLELDESKQLKKFIKGFMIESFLLEGSQNINSVNNSSELNLDGLSITDPCLSWDQTEKLILEIASKYRSISPTLHINYKNAKNATV